MAIMVGFKQIWDDTHFRSLHDLSRRSPEILTREKQTKVCSFHSESTC